MKKFSLIKNNNSKKLYIGVSIIFCAVILIVGGTIAYFTQSDSKKIENLLTADIRDTLEYTDNKDYMRQELIPAKEEIAKQAYALTGENKCIDINGYSACSVYRFNIKNIANVSQELIIDLAPTINNFGNLYFMLYEIDKNGNSINDPIPNKLDTLTEEMIQNSNIPSYNLAKEVILNPNSDKTYEVVFFVNDTGTDQTSEDAGKTFGGTIKITSVTTGKYMVESFGEDCWKTELLSDGTYKLTEFYGIDNNLTLTNENGETVDNPNYGVINNSCTGYINDNDKDGYYSVYIPSKVGKQQITMLGNNLFNARATFDEYEWEITSVNNYSKINNIKIEEGIEIIEDGYDYDEKNDVDDLIGTFVAVGIDSNTLEPDENINISIDLPDTLKTLGSFTFVNSGITSLSIPASVERINKYVFDYTYVLSELIFEGAIEGNSKLTTIEEDAFYYQQLTKLIVPSSVTSFNGFNDNQQLSEVIFLTDNDGKSNLKYLNGLSRTNISSIDIPSGVEVIGNSAFYDSQLTTLIIPNSVTTIEDYAFYSNNISTLTIPNSVTTIGESAFSSNNISTLTIPNSVTTIEDYAFSSSNISTLTIPNSVTTIGDSAFSSNNISTLTIPNSVTTIGDYAFYSNKNLTELTFEEGSQLTTIGRFAFNDCNLTYTDSNNPLVIPSSVTSIGSYAFYSYSSGTDGDPENRYLNYIKFGGTLTAGNTDWYNLESDLGATKSILK